MTEYVTHDDSMEILRSFIEDCGTQAKAAKKLDISPAQLCQILQGNRNPDIALRALGLEPARAYTPYG